VSAALQRYRVIANVVGVVLVVFLLVAVPLRYLGGEPRMSETISPIHGFLYVVYLARPSTSPAGRLVGRAHAARRARRDGAVRVLRRRAADDREVQAGLPA
jgi:hypothetical protein